MNFLIIFSIQLLMMAVGYLMTVLIGLKNKIEALGLSYLFGSGLVTILFLANHYFLNINLGVSNFFIAVGISTISLIALIILFKKQRQIFAFNSLSLKKKFGKLNCFEKFILAFLVLVLGYTLLDNYVWPVTDWDALALYDFRARVMATTGSMLEGIERGYFFQYPPYTSFLHVFGYVFGSERVRVIYSFIYFSLLTVIYSLLKRNKKNWIALGGVFMLSIDSYIFRHATMAYTNLAYVVFLSLGLIYLNFWLTNKERRDLLIGSILLALSTWVRASDPFWYIGLFIIIVGLIKNKKHIKLGLGLIFTSIGIYKFWDIFVKSLNLPTAKNVSRESKYLDALLGNNALLNILSTVPEILSYFWQNIFYTIGYLLPVLLFTVYYDFKKKNLLNKYLYFSLALALLLILAGIVIFSLFYDTWNQIGDSLQRLSMVLTPIAIFAIFNSSIWEEKIFEKK